MILSVEPGEGGGTTAENANNPQTASPPPNNNSENISNNKENMDSSNSPDLSKSGGGDPIRVISNANSNSENIQIMKNLHEYKASFPLVSDDFVKNCIFQYGRDHDRCMEILKEESDRLRMGPVNRRFSLQALLSHQMEQRLRLDKVIRAEKDGYMSLAGQVSDLEMRVKKRDLRIGGPFGRKSEVAEKKENLNKDIGDLQKSCDKLVNQVNSLTEGTVPLGETSIEFYESLRTSTSTSSDAESRARSCTPNNDLPRDIESPRSPQPQHRHSSSVVIEEVQDEDDSPGGEHDGARAEAPQWPCTQCTFLNHPALARCEQCEMPRLVQGGFESR